MWCCDIHMDTNSLSLQMYPSTSRQIFKINSKVVIISINIFRRMIPSFNRFQWINYTKSNKMRLISEVWRFKKTTMSWHLNNSLEEFYIRNGLLEYCKK